MSQGSFRAHRSRLLGCHQGVLDYQMQKKGPYCSDISCRSQKFGWVSSQLRSDNQSPQGTQASRGSIGTLGGNLNDDRPLDPPDGTTERERAY